MRLSRLATIVSRTTKDAWELAGLRYPSFVYGGGLRRGQVPVFCLHDIADERESFASQLEHLHRNGYVTLALDEYVDILAGERLAPERSVVLTFDDGYASTWTLAVPLLKRYAMRATVFVIPGRMSETGVLRPTLEEVWAGRLSEQELMDVTRRQPRLMTWREAAAAQASGVVDVESHGLMHARVFTRPHIVDFVRPGLLARVSLFSLPLFQTGGADALIERPAWGTPLYRSQPLLAAGTRYLESDAVRAACTSYVSSHGGADFFARPGWRRSLSQVEAAARRRAGAPRFQTVGQRRASLRRDIAGSKQALERRLAGRPVRHFCYPWGAGLRETEALVRENGYASGLWLTAPGCWGRLARTGQDPYRIPRLQALWIKSLPGDGRASFEERIAFKAYRRVTAGGTG